MTLTYKDKTWNLPSIAQYEDYEYSASLCCPDCERHKHGYNWIDCNQYDVVGYCEVKGKLQLCCECHICGTKYRYDKRKKSEKSSTRYDLAYHFDAAGWKEDVALLFYLHQGTYRKFEVTTNK